MNAIQELNVTEQSMPPHILVMEDEASVAQGLQMVLDRKSTRLNSSHANESRMPSSA